MKPPKSTPKATPTKSCDGKSDCAERYDDLYMQYRDLQQQYNMLQADHTLLKNLLIKVSDKVSYLEDNIVDLRSRSMKDNIVISGCPEDADDEKDMIKFIKDNMDIEVKPEQVVRAHRLGAPRPDDNDGKKPPPRPLVAKLEYKTKSKIMNKENLKKLKKKKNVFFNHQLPEALKEKEKQVRFQLKHQRQLYEDDRDVEIYIKKDRVHVNNQVIRNKVQTPSINMMLNTSHDERKQLGKIKMTKSSEIPDAGSRFLGCRVNSYDDIQNAYMKVKFEHPSSADVMCSFSLADEFGRQQVELHDDKEHAAASRIYSAIQSSDKENVAVYVVRYFSGHHIGRKRFDHIKSAATEALNLLE